ncbi:hypothetical protein [Embleya sp. NPDC005575]|uniref:hypothetical protein n=1 Tax=Embleya sp. NPDC005575 TaxID=3156892 RepID=UPI0033A5F75A
MRDDAEIVGALDAEGAFPTSWVRGALLAVPRAAFAPDTVWRADRATGRYTAVDRNADPGAWDETVLPRPCRDAGRRRHRRGVSPPVRRHR